VIASTDGTVLCMREESDRPVKNGAGDGWLHRPDGSRPLPRPKPAKPKVARDWRAIAANYTTAIDQATVARLAEQLGVDPIALRELGVGWNGNDWTFPMYAADGQVCGFRRRTRDGEKFAADGCSLGIIRRERPDDGLLLVCEGESDTAAALTLGFDAIGVPGQGQCGAAVAAWARGRDVVIVGDADKSGRDGAAKIAKAIAGTAKSVLTIEPPDGTKDLRVWLRAGAIRADVEAAIEAAAAKKAAVQSGQSVRSAKTAEKITAPQSIEFPADLLDGDDLLPRLVRHVVDTATIPQPTLALGAVLATLGTVLGRRVQLIGGGGSPLRTNIYSLCVGSTASGKNWPMVRTQALLTEAGMGNRLGERKYMSDSAIFSALQDKPAHVAHIDEFGLCLQSTTGAHAPAHLKGINAALLDLYSKASSVVQGAAYANRKENAPVPLIEPCLSVVGYTTPETLVAALTSANVTDGLLGRCLMFEADPNAKQRRGLFRRDSQPVTIASDYPLELQKLAARLDELVPPPQLNLGGYTRPNVRSLYYSDEAAAIAEGLLEERDLNKDRPFGGVWRRMVEQVGKVALIRCASEDPTAEEIQLRHMEWASRLVRWCIGRLEALLREHLADNEIEGKTKRVLAIIAKATAEPGSWMTLSELTRRTQWLNKNERKDILETLVEAEQIVSETLESGRADGKGRFVTRYRVTGDQP
jgi:hypothetical protein